MDMMEPIPYLASQVMRWGGAKEIKLDMEFVDDLGLLVDVIRMANRVPGWEDLVPKYYQWMLQFVYLADFLNAHTL